MSGLPHRLPIPQDLFSNIEGLISLGGGLPSSQYFPLEHIDIKVPVPPHFSEQETKEFGVVKRIGKQDIAEGKSIYGTLDR